VCLRQSCFKAKQSSPWLYMQLGGLYFLAASAQAVRVSIKESGKILASDSIFGAIESISLSIIRYLF